MIGRCTNQKRPDYQFYGGRGISVCRRWSDSFGAFLSDMGTRPSATSLDRIDNSKGYGPNNCRWTTKDQQMQNTRATRLLTLNGRTMGLSAWARDLGLNHSTISQRLRKGWSVERALSCEDFR